MGKYFRQKAQQKQRPGDKKDLGSEELQVQLLSTGGAECENWEDSRVPEEVIESLCSSPALGAKEGVPRIQITSEPCLDQLDPQPHSQ